MSTNDAREQLGEGVLVKEEEKEMGVVSLSVYFSYLSAVGHVLAPAILLSLFLMQGTPCNAMQCLLMLSCDMCVLKVIKCYIPPYYLCLLEQNSKLGALIEC